MAPGRIQDPSTLPSLPVLNDVSSRFVDTAPLSLKFHILESIPKPVAENRQPPLILCVHGYPNLAYDWRFILPKLADAGYHAVAFDQRGYGRTHMADLTPIPDSSLTPMNLVRDVVTLVHALGHTQIHTIVGHDFGASTSSLCTLFRPDFIKSLVLMSHPYPGAPEIPYASSPSLGLPPPPEPAKDPYESLKDPHIHDSLLKLSPPRKHYKWYNCTDEAEEDWSRPSGPPLHDFLRGYFHTKSADYELNDPHPLQSWTADQLQTMPYYYIMLAEHGMRQNIAEAMALETSSSTRSSPTKEERAQQLANCRWLPDSDLQVYVDEYSRTSFRQALRWYRIYTDPNTLAEVQTFASARLSVPTKFVSGVKDWGNFQEPGAVEAMEQARSVREGYYRGSVYVEGAGHWVNMEQPQRCVEEILKLADEVSQKENGGTAPARFGWF